MNPVNDACRFPAYLEKVLQSAFALAPDFTRAPRLVSRATVTRRQPFTVTPAAAAHRVRALKLIQAHLRQVGVDVRTTFVSPAAVLFTQIAPSGDFDGALFAFFTTSDTLGSEIHRCAGSVNFTGYCQRLVTADLDQADRTLDVGRRARVLNRADARIAQDVPLLPLFQVPNVLAFRSTIRNVSSAGGHELWKAENWWLAESR